MDRTQALHIHTVLKYGLELQKLFPTIAQEYRKLSCRKIAKKYKLATRFNIHLDTAISVVQKALRGYDGSIPSIHIEAYHGLLTEKEMDTLGQEHVRLSGVKTGKAQVKAGTGIHAQTPMERVKAIYNALRARGIKNPKPIVPFGEEEKKFIISLTKKKAYQRDGFICNQKIADMVNKTYYAKQHKKGIHVRDDRSIRAFIQRLRKHKEL